MDPVIEENEIEERSDVRKESSLTITTCEEVSSDNEESADNDLELDSKINNELSNSAQFVRTQTSVGTFGEVKIENSQDVHFGNKIFAAPITVVNAIGEEEQDKLGILDALRERFPNKFLENDIFNQFKNEKQECNLFWYVVTGFVLLLSATILIGATIATWNTLHKDDGDNIVETPELFINETWFVTRTRWHASRPLKRDLLRLPVAYFVICHTVSKFYNDSDSCTNYVSVQQKDHMFAGWNDIGYNYMVCGNGDVYVGRGSNVIGSHTYGVNSNSIGLAFIGDYSRNDFLNEKQIQNTKLLISELVKNGKLSHEYKLIPAKIVSGLDSPGINIEMVIQNWNHYKESLDDSF